MADILYCIYMETNRVPSANRRGGRPLHVLPVAAVPGGPGRSSRYRYCWSRRSPSSAHLVGDAPAAGRGGAQPLLL
jgi:hypothetical protein